MQTRHRPLPDDSLYLLPDRPLSRPKPGLDVQRWLQPPAEFTSAFCEAIAWISAAAALRLVMDGLLASSTAFWTPVLVVIVAPAAIAVSLSTLMPRLSLVLGYRLILVMAGLLIGGKL